jgi:hypothetical protein
MKFGIVIEGDLDAIIFNLIVLIILKLLRDRLEDQGSDRRMGSEWISGRVAGGV